MKKENKKLAQQRRAKDRKKNALKKCVIDLLKNRIPYILVVVIAIICIVDVFGARYTGVIYLTFDDGPGQYTEQLLDVLDKYDVKATFFVTNQFPKYQNMIREAHKRGHTIGLHTYSHDYEEIYQSEEAYYEDLTKIHNICVEQTGVKPKIVRFPGGTDNTISKKYCSGIMSNLSKTLITKGYVYTDWNVNSLDTDGADTKEAVVEKVLQGIRKNETSIVLQHDTKQYSVEAVEDIIQWGIEHGYKFSRMKKKSPMIQNTVQN